MHAAATFATWFFLFIIYSIIGWCIEVLRNLILLHKFTNRGFLIGPICPIYGCGGVLMSLILYDITSPLVIFIVATAVSAIVEYIASYIMEKLFHVRWWDYSNYKFNLNGRVCLFNLVCFGVIGVIVLCLLNPLLFKWLNSIPEVPRVIAACIGLVILILDIAVSLWLIIGCRVTAGTVNPDATEEIAANIHEILMHKGKLNRRLSKAFPEAEVSGNNKSSTKPKTPSKTKQSTTKVAK